MFLYQNSQNLTTRTKDNADELGEDPRAEVNSEGIDMETDLLPHFCLHKENILLSSNWVNGIKHVRQRLEGGVVQI